MTRVLTPEFKASYPNLFRARKNDLNGKDEYSVMALFTKGQDLKILTDAVIAVTEKKWGKDKTKWPKNLRSPFRDQAEKVRTNEETGKEYLPEGYEAGAVFITLRGQRRPGIVDGRKGNAEIIDESEIYAGVKLRAAVSVYAYDQKGNRGVALGLVAIQKVADGEPIAGTTSKAEDLFTPIAGATGGGADALSAFN